MALSYFLVTSLMLPAICSSPVETDSDAKKSSFVTNLSGLVPPENCVWDEWTDWDGECPKKCADPKLYRKEEADSISVQRVRPVKERGNRFGTCFAHNDTKKEKPLKVLQRRLDKEIKICPKVEICKVSSRFSMPIDCVWSEWYEWEPEEGKDSLPDWPGCPKCRDDAYYQPGEKIVRWKERTIKEKGNRAGECYKSTDTKKEHPLKMHERRWDQEEEDCPKVPTCIFPTAEWLEWGEWGFCVSPEGKDERYESRRTRRRKCHVVNPQKMEVDEGAMCKTLIDFSKEVGAAADVVGTSCPSLAGPEKKVKHGYRSGVAAANEEQGGKNLPKEKEDLKKPITDKDKTINSTAQNTTSSHRNKFIDIDKTIKKANDKLNEVIKGHVDMANETLEKGKKWANEAKDKLHEVIKGPMEMANKTVKKWKDLVSEAKDKWTKVNESPEEIVEKASAKAKEVVADTSGAAKETSYRKLENRKELASKKKEIKKNGQKKAKKVVTKANELGTKNLHKEIGSSNKTKASVKNKKKRADDEEKSLHKHSLPRKVTPRF